MSDQAHYVKDPTQKGDPLLTCPKIKGFEAIASYSGAKDTITPCQ